MLSSATSSLACQRFNGVAKHVRTFEKLAAIGLARGDFEGDNVALQRVRRVKDGRSRKERTCASFSSLIGIPIVEVMVVVGGGYVRDGWWWFGALGEFWCLRFWRGGVSPNFRVKLLEQ